MKYELRDKRDLVQVHPTDGRRRVMDVSGHGQHVHIGEVGADLLILDVWRVMGDKDARLIIKDRETLETKTAKTIDEFKIDRYRKNLKSVWKLPKVSSGE